jgi:hypothetical protein
MAYSRFSSRFRRRGFKKVAVGAKPKPVYRKKYSRPRVSFAKKVNQIIARNVENKFTNAYSVDGYILQWSTGSPKIWYHMPIANNCFSIGQGTAQNNRVGNQIKVKRWVLKGTVHPSQDANVSPTTTQYLRYSYQGYAMVYLLKRTNGEDIDTELPGLYQNGSSSYAAAGTYLDHMLPINKDRYKVYATRKFKLGPAAPISASSTDNNIMMYNNDYKLVGDFGFDITRFVGKNAIIKYSDGTTTAQLPPALRGLEVVCVWSPPFGSMSAQTLASSTSFYKISCTCHVEYEDA